MKTNKYIQSSIWIFFEYGVRTVAAIFVGIYVARYLGPERFGIFSLYLSIAAIAASIARLGLDSILIKEVVSNPSAVNASLASGFWLMQLSGILIVAGLCFVGLFVGQGDLRTPIYLFFACGQVIFQPFSFVESFYQAKANVVGISVSKALIVIVSSAIKIYAVNFHAELLFFFVIAFGEQVLQAALFLLIWTKRQRPRFFLEATRIDAKRLLETSWPLLVSALAINIYTRIDQIMINAMLGHEAGGIYSATIKIYEAWTAMPYLLSLAFFPAILTAKEVSKKFYEKRIIILMRTVFWTAMLVTLFCWVFASQIIQLSFGAEYLGAEKILGWVMFSSAWVALGSVSSRYLVAEGLEKFIAGRTIFSAILNIVLNFILLPVWGIWGAVCASIFCAISSNYIFDFANSKLRRLRKIKSSAIFFFNLRD